MGNFEANVEVKPSSKRPKFTSQAVLEKKGKVGGFWKHLKVVQVELKIM